MIPANIDATAKQVLDVLSVGASNEPYRAAMFFLGFEEFDGSDWWCDVMDRIEEIIGADE